MQWTISTVMMDNCWKRDPDDDREYCKVPDITMVRIDYIGWIVVYIRGARFRSS